MFTRSFKGFAIISLLFCLLVSCSPTIAVFDQYAYTQATAAKVDVLNLMELATDSFQHHEQDIKTVKTTLRKLYEYDKGRYRNAITIKQWEILNDTTGNLFGGFLRYWKEKKVLSPAYIYNKQGTISTAFDQIIKLEKSKNKAK